jgi:hypothetical protein
VTKRFPFQRIVHVLNIPLFTYYKSRPTLFSGISACCFSSDDDDPDTLPAAAAAAANLSKCVKIPAATAVAFYITIRGK